MKKILSVIVAMVLCVVAIPFNVFAERTVQYVTVDAPAGIIEVEQGQQNVLVTWNMSKNEGWHSFKFFVEFDGDVFSFNPGGDAWDLEDPEVEPYSFNFYPESSSARKKISSVSPNIFGMGSSADPTISKDRSSFLLVGPSGVNMADIDKTGPFFVANLNIANDAKPGVYDIKITVDAGASTSNPSASVPEITFGTAKVIVKNPPLAALGAQIRIPDYEQTLPVQGLRLVSSISIDQYNMAKEAGIVPTSYEDKGLGFGTVVIPTELLGTATLTKETANAEIIPAVKLLKAPSATEAQFTVCLTDMTTKEHFETKYTYVPYLTYMDAGIETTIYGTPYTVSAFDIAVAFCNDPTNYQYNQEYINNSILNVVDPDTYPKISNTSTVRP